MKCLQRCVLFACFVGIFGRICAESAGPAQQSPNILLIIADDLGAKDLGCTGSTFYHTPNIDRLASEGILFNQAYAAAHVCSPTRASIMTGKYPARLHLTDFIPGHPRNNEKLSVPKWSKSLPDEETTLGELFLKAGYATAWLGKWHLGGGGALQQGFMAGVEDYTYNKEENQEDPKGTQALNKAAMEFIKANQTRPFFVTLSHYSVHTPMRFNNSVRDRYAMLVKSTDQKQRNPDYAAMLEALDDSVGTMMQWLDKEGLAQNTVVIFISDNGGLLPFTDNFPLRAGKGHLYEGGTRIPMIVRWPGHSPKGTQSNDAICTIDFLPTLCSIAGIQAPKEIDGINFSATFSGKVAPAREALYWHYPHYHQGAPSGTILCGNMKLLEFFEDMHTELYDLSKDPSEKINLAAQQPELTKQLTAKLHAWRSSVGAQMMSPNPKYNPNKAKKSSEGPKDSLE